MMWSWQDQVLPGPPPNFISQMLLNCGTGLQFRDFQVSLAQVVGAVVDWRRCWLGHVLAAVQRAAVEHAAAASALVIGQWFSFKCQFGHMVKQAAAQRSAAARRASSAQACRRLADERLRVSERVWVPWYSRCRERTPGHRGSSEFPARRLSSATPAAIDARAAATGALAGWPGRPLGEVWCIWGRGGAGRSRVHAVWAGKARAVAIREPGAVIGDSLCVSCFDTSECPILSCEMTSTLAQPTLHIFTSHSGQH